MARPTKNYCDYFPHKKEMRNHRKIKALRTKFGLSGYAIWCMFLELLTGTDGNEIENSEQEMELIAGDFGVTVEEISGIVNYCLKVELFFDRNGFIYQESLDENLKPVYDKRQTSKELSKKQVRNNGKYVANHSVLNGVTVTETPQTELNRTELNRTETNTGKKSEDEVRAETVKKNAERNPGFKQLSAEKQSLVLKLISKEKSYGPVDDEIIESGLIKFWNLEIYLSKKSISKEIPDDFYYSPNDDKFYSLLDLLHYFINDTEFLNQTKLNTKLTERADVVAWLTHFAAHFYTEGMGSGVKEIKKHIKYCWSSFPGEKFRENQKAAFLKKQQGR